MPIHEGKTEQNTIGPDRTGRRARSLAAIAVSVSALTFGVCVPSEGAETGPLKAEDVITCVDMGAQSYCDLLGLIDKESLPQAMAEIQRVLDGAPDTVDSSSTGGDSLSADVAKLAALTPEQRRSRFMAENADAIEAARLAQAAEKRLRSSGSNLQALLPEFGAVLTDLTVAGYKQIKRHYCGPATTRAIAHGGGVNASQETWASRLGTTSKGTSTAAIVAVLNKYVPKYNIRGWGGFSVFNVSAWSDAYFRDNVKHRIGKLRRPVVMHPKLTKAYFTHIRKNHGGHFQPGLGYVGNLLGFFEVYNERDFDRDGANSAGYRTIKFSDMKAAIIATGMPTVGL